MAPKEIKLPNLNTHIILLVLVFSMMLTTSCSLTKNLAEGQNVYMGTDINIHDANHAKSIRDFKHIVNGIPQAGTANGIGNIKTGLHNIFANTGDTGFKHWVKYRLGSKPIIYKPDMIEITEAKLEYYLRGKGFFSNRVACDTTVNNRKANIKCDVTLNQRHRIDSLVFPSDTVYTTLDLDEASKRFILEENSYYDRDRLEYERLRITTLAANKGYADFKATNVHFYVDTAKVDNTVDVYTQIISPTDSTRHIRYTLDSILVFPNFSKRSSTSITPTSTDLKNSVTIVETEPYLDHALYERLILEEPEGYYNRSLQYRTTKRFQNLGLFKVVNIINEPSINGLNDHITQRILLSPLERQSLSGEVELNNRAGNTFGVGASVAYQNRNLFGQAENLNISIGGQVETQFGDGVSFVNSSDINGNVELTFPRFIVPFFTIQENKNYIPRTVIKGDYTFQRRTELYSIESFTYKFGYRWRQTVSKLHELYPLNVNQISVTNETQDFLDLLSQDIRLQRSFRDVLIVGMQYDFTFTSQTNSTDRSSHYLRASLETSGNALSLFLGADNINPKEIVGSEFAQFSKATVDFRKYWGFSESDLATRIILGFGRAYGNSQELPYPKQYFVGGSNSLRAFRIRGLGPGSFYVDPDGLSAIESQLVDQTGDMKLEMNVEYRFPVIKYFKSAVFLDAGNIWLLDSPDRPKEGFDLTEFYKQIAIGAGVGFRLDFDFFLIRLDIAFPVRSPSESDFVWHITDIDLLSRTWRQDNLRYNLGIGYPF